MIYTVGHSTMSQELFLGLTKDLDVLMDVRSHPTSKWPQFRMENMSSYLGNRYKWEPRLGGWDKQHINLVDDFSKYHVDILAYTKGKFPKQRIDPKIKEGIEEDRPHWYNQGLWDYQFFMTLPEFIDGADELIERSKSINIGICCCECLWWCCHRSMISDYLFYKGVEAVHLQPKTTLHSKVISNRIERYHPDVLSIWGKPNYIKNEQPEQQLIFK